METKTEDSPEVLSVETQISSLQQLCLPVAASSVTEMSATNEVIGSLSSSKFSSPRLCTILLLKDLRNDDFSFSFWGNSTAYMKKPSSSYSF